MTRQAVLAAKKRLKGSIENWWDVATEWRQVASQARSGELGAAATAHGLAHGVNPNTLRRLLADLTFAERLMGMYPWLSRAMLEGMALTSLQALGRMSRFDEAGLEAHVLAVIQGTLAGKDLIALEASVRRRQAPLEPGEGGATLRMRGALFREEAIRAYAGMVRSTGGRLDRVASGGPLPPLALDALFHNGDGAWRGLRTLTASNHHGLASRIKEAALLAMAGARILESFTFVVQLREDAVALARAMASAGADGAGVMGFHPGSGLAVELAPTRSQPPDLAQANSARLLAWLGTTNRTD